MARSEYTPIAVAAQVRRMLKQGGSVEHANGVQWFFKEEIKSHGWYTAALRKAAAGMRRSLQKEHRLEFVVQVADHLFAGQVLEEKVFAVLIAGKAHGGIWKCRIPPV